MTTAPFATAADLPISRGTISYLRTGVALADILIARNADRALGFDRGDTVEIVLTDKEDRPSVFQFTCWRVGIEGGFWGAALCGGRAKLGTVIEPRYYENAEGTIILHDALDECGERMAGESTITSPLGTYVRRLGPAFQDIAALVSRYPEATWRTLPNGSIWAGEETWPDAPFRVTVLQRTPQQQRYLCEAAPEVECGSIVYDFTGYALGGVERVVHEITTVLRTRLFLSLIGEAA